MSAFQLVLNLAVAAALALFLGPIYAASWLSGALCYCWFELRQTQASRATYIGWLNDYRERDGNQLTEIMRLQQAAAAVLKHSGEATCGRAVVRYADLLRLRAVIDGLDKVEGSR